MAYKVHILQEAEMDIEEAVRWYESKSIGLGGKFLDDLFDQLRYLRQNPEYFPKNEDGFREVNLKSFPYLVIYDISSGTVTIWAVFNTYQNPLKKP